MRQDAQPRHPYGEAKDTFVVESLLGEQSYEPGMDEIEPRFCATRPRSIPNQAATRFGSRPGSPQLAQGEREARNDVAAIEIVILMQGARLTNTRGPYIELALGGPDHPDRRYAALDPV